MCAWAGVLSSSQHAGKHLRELQKTLKNPLSNFGLVLTEGIKRSQRCVVDTYMYIRILTNRVMIVQMCSVEFTGFCKMVDANIVWLTNHATHLWTLNPLLAVTTCAISELSDMKNVPVEANPLILNLRYWENTHDIFFCDTIQGIASKVRSKFKGEKWVKWRLRHPFCKILYLFTIAITHTHTPHRMAGVSTVPSLEGAVAKELNSEADLVCWHAIKVDSLRLGWRNRSQKAIVCSHQLMSMMISQSVCTFWHARVIASKAVGSCYVIARYCS